jgi:hypothetical protein
MNFMYTVLNAGIPVIYIVVSAHALVMCVIRHSVIGAILQNINAYIVVSALILVICVIRHSLVRAIL